MTKLLAIAFLLLPAVAGASHPAFSRPAQERALEQPGEGLTPSVGEDTRQYAISLVSFGDKKIAVIKLVRELTGLGLKDSKELVEGVPQTLPMSVSAQDADAIAERFQSLGAEVEIVDVDD